MIFRPELVRLIRQGKKTQTRRIVTGATCRYQATKSYALQPGRGKHAVGRITITAVRPESLGAISLRDAKREGFVTTHDFIDYWTGLHGRFDRDLMVWVISFSLGDTTDVPRLLAARPGAPHGDYVTESRLAMVDEPEAISGWEAERFAKASREADDVRRKDAIRGSRDKIAAELTVIRDHLATANGADRDLSSAVRVAERGIATADRGLRALERKLESPSTKGV